MIEGFLLAHLGPGATEIGDAPFARAALHLFLSGRVDLPALRLERNLSTGLDDGARLVVLGLFARLRAGHPQATLAELLQEIESGLSNAPDRTPRDFELQRHLAALAICRQGLLDQTREALDRIASTPDAQGLMFGPPTRDPLPLVVVAEGVLSFARFHAAQTELVELVSRMAVRESGIDPETADRVLTEIDTLPGWPLHEAQRVAVAASLRASFLILTGGPGTGKTTVVSRILLALSRCLPDFDPEAVALCAPTGRAKARLSESLGQNLKLLAATDPVASALASVQASTLHSLLGALPDGSFRHHSGNPLPHRVVVLDEASMVDLPLFAAFLAALSPRARLVVVGDPDQLPSVDAGAVLADLVGNPCLQGARAHLTHTHRNSGDIAEICRIVSRGEPVGEWLASRSRDRSDGRVEHLGASSLEAQVRTWLDSRFADAVRRSMASGFADLSPILDAVERSRILCAVHEGDAGALALNRAGDHWLRDVAGLSGKWRFLPGQQLILTRNHPSRDLWNGDLGVAALRDDRLVAVFRKPGGEIALPVEQLDGLESAWAITVHKSQGSEFDEILFVLPDRDTPVLTRQILYTALSRARRAVLVHGDPRLADRAVSRSADRPGRLRGAAVLTAREGIASPTWFQETNSLR
ncbi:MAG TPA: exodeoxyribonuclease V subunit alpha [Fibrobacteria bacterium]|nr:exodeoxyribonuclease V subunit alpha [Fibrobacteria bacterium]